MRADSLLLRMHFSCPGQIRRRHTGDQFLPLPCLLHSPRHRCLLNRRLVPLELELLLLGPLISLLLLFLLQLRGLGLLLDRQGLSELPLCRRLRTASGLAEVVRVRGISSHSSIALLSRGRSRLRNAEATRRAPWLQHTTRLLHCFIRCSGLFPLPVRSGPRPPLHGPPSWPHRIIRSAASVASASSRALRGVATNVVMGGAKGHSQGSRGLSALCRRGRGLAEHFLYSGYRLRSQLQLMARARRALPETRHSGSNRRRDTVRNTLEGNPCSSLRGGAPGHRLPALQGQQRIALARCASRVHSQSFLEFFGSARGTRQM